MTRVLVCGGRKYGLGNDKEKLHVSQVLSALHDTRFISTVIEGGAEGADACAKIWADQASVPSQTYNADWKSHGRSAGPRRNQWMLDEGKPDLVVAFPGGSGTADMVRRAKAAGLEVIEIPELTITEPREQ